MEEVNLDIVRRSILRCPIYCVVHSKSHHQRFRDLSYGDRDTSDFCLFGPTLSICQCTMYITYSQAVIRERTINGLNVSPYQLSINDQDRWARIVFQLGKHHCTRPLYGICWDWRAGLYRVPCWQCLHRTFFSNVNLKLVISYITNIPSIWEGGKRSLVTP